MATNNETTPQRRIEDHQSAAKIDWSQPGAPAVPLSSTAGAARQGGNTNNTGSVAVDLDKLRGTSEYADVREEFRLATSLGANFCIPSAMLNVDSLLAVALARSNSPAGSTQQANADTFDEYDFDLNAGVRAAKEAQAAHDGSIGFRQIRAALRAILKANAELLANGRFRAQGGNTSDNGSSASTASVAAPDLHNAIMNLPCNYRGDLNFEIAYKNGHRDARHAAAELVAASESESDVASVAALEGLTRLTDVQIASAPCSNRSFYDAADVERLFAAAGSPAQWLTDERIKEIAGRLNYDDYETYEDYDVAVVRAVLAAAGIASTAAATNRQPVGFHVTYDNGKSVDYRATESEAHAHARELVENGWPDVNIRTLGYLAAPSSDDVRNAAWISVDERLPDEYLLRFLVIGRALQGGPLGVHMATIHEGIMYFEGADPGGCNPSINDVVTHWMPLSALPEAPRTSTKDQDNSKGGDHE